MYREDKFKEKLKTTLESIDENFVPKHIGNGIYLCKEMNLICNKDFLDEVNNAIIEEVKNKR